MSVMSLALKFLSGPIKGQTRPVRSGMTLGRGDADLVIVDPRLSQKHAEIREDNPGSFLLVDLNSTNGIRLNGKKTASFLLKEGLEFKLGQSQVRVIQSGETSLSPDDEVTQPALPGPPPLDPLVEPSEEPPALGPESHPKKDSTNPEPESWRTYFSGFCQRAQNNVQDRPIELTPFPRVLTMTFKRGLQVGTTWTVGYGPRAAGKSSLDLALYGEDVPDIAFVLEARGENVIFTTDFPELVRHNGKENATGILLPGDRISADSFDVEVDYEP